MNLLDKCFNKDRQLVARNIAGETIIVPVREEVGDLSSIYTMNELGTRIWELMNGRTRVGDIINAIVGEYDVTEEEATRDVSDYLRVLEAAGLIRSEKS